LYDSVNVTNVNTPDLGIEVGFILPQTSPASIQMHMLLALTAMGLFRILNWMRARIRFPAIVLFQHKPEIHLISMHC
jgi:hypothetical protein